MNSNKIKVFLACNKCNSRNYSIYKNKNASARLELKKFCAKCNSATLHKETK